MIGSHYTENTTELSIKFPFEVTWVKHLIMNPSITEILNIFLHTSGQIEPPGGVQENWMQIDFDG